MSTIPTDRYMLFVGNSGVGKSWLLNQMLGQDVFESDISVDGVTTTLEAAQVTDPNDGSIIQFLNIPGLVEAKKAHIERNTRVLREALSKNGKYKVMFVFGGGFGGRVQPKDVFAYKEFCKGYNLEHLPVIVNNLPLNLKPGENKANKLRAYWGMMSETLQESGIHGSCQIIEYAASRDDIVRKVIMAAEAFPWQAITSEPKPMNFDEQSQAAEEAMRQYEAQVEALNIELKANKAKMEQLEKEARGREEQQRLKYEQELEAMRARARRPFGDLMEMLVRLLSGKV